MDRSFEEIRADVLSLDNEHLRELVDEAEARLAAPLTDADYEEAAERLRKYDRGEMSSVTAEESIAKLRQMIQRHKPRS